MGPKVTIDSATMMNKGLEIIEAHFLFDIEYARIEVAIHPDSVVHSYVEFWDGAVIAQLGAPDMRLPIALALSDGERLPEAGRPLELRGGRPIEVLPVDLDRFPAVAVARRAGERGGIAPAALNAANEVAVAAFLEGACRFDEIVPIAASAVDAAIDVVDPSLDDVLAADQRARAHASGLLHSEAPVT
jgi:1-deoxy-D-xylulose-5-phosphate reductoisomerase